MRNHRFIRINGKERRFLAKFKVAFKEYNEIAILTVYIIIYYLDW